MLNIEEYPESAASYKSLGDAYRIIGKTGLAIDNYQKSLVINPDDEVVKKSLESLKQNPRQNQGEIILF